MKGLVMFISRKRVEKIIRERLDYLAAEERRAADAYDALHEAGIRPGREWYLEQAGADEETARARRSEAEAILRALLG